MNGLLKDAMEVLSEAVRTLAEWDGLQARVFEVHQTNSTNIFKVLHFLGKLLHGDIIQLKDEQDNVRSLVLATPLACSWSTSF